MLLISLTLWSMCWHIQQWSPEKGNRRRVKSIRVHNDDRDPLSIVSTSPVLSWSVSDNVLPFKSQQRLWSENHISTSERSTPLLKGGNEESSSVWILCDMLWTQQSKNILSFHSRLSCTLLELLQHSLCNHSICNLSWRYSRSVHGTSQLLKWHSLVACGISNSQNV